MKQDAHHLNPPALGATGNVTTFGAVVFLPKMVIRALVASPVPSRCCGKGRVLHEKFSASFSSLPSFTIFCRVRGLCFFQNTRNSGCRTRFLLFWAISGPGDVIIQFRRKIQLGTDLNGLDEGVRRHLPWQQTVVHTMKFLTARAVAARTERWYHRQTKGGHGCHFAMRWNCI